MFIVKLIPSRILSLQARKPSGLIGRYVMGKIFNAGNADLNAFAKETLALKKDDRVLEIGFGPGQLISGMAEITTEGFVEGVDFSVIMLKQASNVNRRHILNGRVKLQEGEGRHLRFDNESFDKLCSVNTLYFWEEPDKYFSYQPFGGGFRLALPTTRYKELKQLHRYSRIFFNLSHFFITHRLALGDQR